MPLLLFVVYHPPSCDGYRAFPTSCVHWLNEWQENESIFISI
jgi:hypothetical protein